MQTIKIQNCTEFKDKFFKVIVNGEKHVIPHQFIKVNVANDDIIKIKAKYFWNSSPVYTFEPRENISIQILMNQRMKRWSLLGVPFGGILGVVIGNLFKDKPFLAFGIILLVFVIYVVISKRTYIIRELDTTD